MTPHQTWKANKWRLDMRSYTRLFQKRFESRSKIQVHPGSVYAIKYLTEPDILTDKYHFTPIVISFGRFRDDDGDIYTRGINLMYLRNEQKIEILEEVYKYSSFPPDARVAPIIQIHDKWMKIAPYAFKNLEESRIIGLSEVEVTEWGMIPLLKEALLGTFNARLLNEDFQKENKEPIIKKKKKKKSQPVENKKVEDENEYEEIIFDENGMIDLDDDD